MNTKIKRLGIFLVLCYLALFLKLNQVQVLQADELNNHPYNGRRVVAEYNRPRGQILSGEGDVLAMSVEVPEDTGFKRSRLYPTGDLFGHLTGFFSFKYGAAGVEKSYNAELTGATFIQQVDSFRDLAVTREPAGNVTLSVRKDLQGFARQQLSSTTGNPSQQGSIVVLDPRSGELLAFWSSPSYDPNLISGLDQDVDRLNWDRLNEAPGNPMQAHQYQENYFPGSTFKLVTAGVGLQTGKVTDDEPVYPAASAYQPPKGGKPIQNFGGGTCGGALPQILMVSCNSAFARMGAETIGPADMAAGAESFGFNREVPIDLPAAARSQFPTIDQVANNPAKLAQASIGQNDTRSTPLQMALVVCAAAHQGRVMTPHVMKRVTDTEGNEVARYDPKPWIEPMSADRAETLRQDMLGVVSSGTGTAARISGYEVGGKTGTAQTGVNNLLHTWFVGFAGPPGSVPTVVVAVVLLNVPDQGGESTGGALAAPIARNMMQRVLQLQGGGA